MRDALILFGKPIRELRETSNFTGLRDAAIALHRRALELSRPIRVPTIDEVVTNRSPRDLKSDHQVY
jgi:hypothetical protein